MKKRFSCLILSVLFVFLASAQTIPGSILSGLISVSAADSLPTEPHITLEKNEFEVGEDIIFSAWGDENTSINFYPAHSVPGKDATIYYAYFEGSGQEKTIPLNTPVSVTELPGDNRGHAQVGHYYDAPLPIGQYKLVLRQSGTPILQVDVSIVPKKTDKPFENLPSTPHITLEKTEFEVGEDIIFAAWGDQNTVVCFYPISFVPGKDATIYYANFSDYGADLAIPLNTPTKVTDMPGNNRGHAQVGHYYDAPLPVGQYKLVLRQSGTLVLQVNVTIVPKKTDKPFENLPTVPHITLEKTEFAYGEDIIFATWGDSNTSINFYPINSVPGTDATIYWAYFEGSDQEKTIPLNTPVSVTELPGDNRGHWQVGHYYDEPLPAGRYKLVLRQSGTPIYQVDVTILEPFEKLPESPHITMTNTEFEVGEEIVFAAWGDENTSINLYPIDFVPDTDASIYWAYFEGSDMEKTIPLNTIVSVTDLPGNNRGHAQVNHYYKDYLPAGEYKLVLRQSGELISQVNFSVRDPKPINDISIEGSPTIGKVITLKGIITNRSAEDRIFHVTLSRPMLSTSATTDSRTFTVKAGESTDVSFQITPLNGGSLLLGINLLDEDGMVISREITGVTVPGAGFYVGDAHTHSILSDGKNTLKENFTSAYNKGQSWMFTADHNFQHSDTTQTDTALKGFDTFLALTGNEITSDYGHMLEYGTPHRHPTNTSGSMYECMANMTVTVDVWQSIMDEIISEGGACYIAHPFFWSSTGAWKWPGIGTNPTNVYSYSGFTGIEVYNADSDATAGGSQKTAQAFELWDRYNLKGEQHYFGICNTDGHTDDIVSTAVNALMIDELSADNVLATLKNGHFYGTNGPEMRFTLSDGANTVSFGETLSLPESKKATMSIQVGNQGSPLTKVILYKYTMTGNVETAYENREVTVLFDSSKDGETFVFTYEQEVDVADGVFYRIEVEAVESAYGDDRRGGFAFSNPIWVGADISLDFGDDDSDSEDTEPSDTDPIETEPSDTEPSDTKPSDAESTDTQPTDTLPTAVETDAETPDSSEVTTVDGSSEKSGGCASTIAITAVFPILTGLCLVWKRRKED